MRDTASILTCVTNAGGVGPGHTAISIGDTVYTFENWKDWFSKATDEKSGWLEFPFGKYLEANAHRPVIIQELTSKVNSQKARKYIQSSKASDADYLSSGVCSSLVANAVNAAWSGWFDPIGVDTPYKVYHLAKITGIVVKTKLSWQGREKLSLVIRGLIEVKLIKDYDAIQIA